MDPDLSRTIDGLLKGKSQTRLTLTQQPKDNVESEDEQLRRAIELSKQMLPPARHRDVNEKADLVDLTTSDGECDYELAIRLSKEEQSSYDAFHKLVTEDEKLARQLQQTFNREQGQSSMASPKANTPNKYANMAPHLETQLCSHEWESIDPNPDIYSLFIQFDQRFFWNSLGAVQLEWSKRMYSCAGICYYQKRGRAER